jgi:hypothetical protein
LRAWRQSPAAAFIKTSKILEGAGWPAARRLAFDVGVASGPWGQGHFLESLGAGFFAWTTSRFDGVDQGSGGSGDPEDELWGARRFLRERLP